MIVEMVIQGDSITIGVVFKDKVSGLPLDLTGATARMAIVDASGVQKYITTSNIITEPLAGKISHLVPAAISNVTVGSKLFSDIEVTYSTGVVKTYAQTTYVITKGYTNG